MAFPARPSPAAALIVLALVALPTAQAAALAQAVPPGDAASGQSLIGRRAVLAFMDLDFDSQVDLDGPASFPRNQETWTSTVRSSTTISSPQTRSSSSCREKTLPGSIASVASSPNSFGRR